MLVCCRGKGYWTGNGTIHFVVDRQKLSKPKQATLHRSRSSACAADRQQFLAGAGGLRSLPRLRHNHDRRAKWRLLLLRLEISPAYCDVIVKRWQAFTGGEATLDGDGRTFAQIDAERFESEKDRNGAGCYDDALAAKREALAAV